MYRILVVDDEPSICEALALGLASEEFLVDAAPNGESGVRQGCAEKYDVLIVDLYLPDMDGIEVIRRVKAYHPEVLSIVITGHHTVQSFNEAKQCGVNDYFEKPFPMKSIRAAITRGLEERSFCWPKQLRDTQADPDEGH